MTALGGDVRRAKLAATLLLTLPGIPFLYYGEEIGLPGPKDGQPEADMGVRTPMPWSAAPNAGFSTGRPWHAPRPGWEHTNVAAQSADASSLLREYRRLIELRRTVSALAVGDWVPLEASDPGVLAFLRRYQGREVLVLINLTDDVRANVAVHSGSRVMRPGSYRPRTLLGTGVARPLRIGSRRVIDGYGPFPRLEPFATHILALN
jgi:glycosidase